MRPRDLSSGPGSTPGPPGSLVLRKSTSSRGLSRVSADLRAIVHWYFGVVWGQHEGPGVLPFYCDPSRVGYFAVTPQELQAGGERSLFRLFVAFSMYQARRDVVIMGQQRRTSYRDAAVVASVATVARRVAANPCRMLRSAEAFEVGCSVRKSAGEIDCQERPGAPCVVKEGTAVFNRMGDLGKLPTSAWLNVWQRRGLESLLDDVRRIESDPRKRAELLVGRLSRVRRVGRKLATMFVSALSVPSLAAGFAPWYPDVDGNDLVVVDTNVLKAVGILRGANHPRTHEEIAAWLRQQARKLDLTEFSADAEVPRYSPRLVQQALYSFCSRSNRVAREDLCAGGESLCLVCVPRVCPFSEHDSTSGP